MSAATSPKTERRWLCIHHWRTRFDPTGSQMALKDMQRSGVPPVENWLDEEMAKFDHRKVEIAKAMRKVAEKYTRGDR